MSLLDALLLEGYRDPRDVWIALRSDGQKGSGTIDDPYDGGTRLGPALSATLTCNLREFVVGTQFAHGLLPGDVGVALVTINSVRGPGLASFNGTFTLKEILSPLHFVLEITTPYLPTAPPDVESSAFEFTRTTYPNNTGNLNTLPAIARIFWPVAKVATTVPHGLPSFGAVKVEGITSPYAGEYVALGPDSSGQKFAFRLSSLPPADDTSPLSCTVTKINHRFDEAMRSVPVYSVIHLGPGTFETRGGAPDYLAHINDWTQVHVGFVVRQGQRLLGSGIGATTVTLVLPIDGINQTTAITHFSNQLATNADYAEVADLTVDCNALFHAAPYGIFPAPVTCGAVDLAGSFMSLRRVRAINFCVQAYSECFALALGPGKSLTPGVSQPPVFNVIEDCIVEKPGENNTHETTLLNIHTDRYGNGRSAIVRHNYLNCTYPSGASSEYVAIDHITYDGADARVITKRPHNRFVRITVNQTTKQKMKVIIMKKALVYSLGLAVTSFITTARADRHESENGSGHESIEQEITLSPTVNAPTNALGRADMETKSRRGTNVTRVEVKVAGLPSGTYTVAIGDVTGTNSYSLGSITVSPYTRHGDNDSEHHGTKTTVINPNVVVVNYGSGRFTLPSLLNPTNVALICVSDTNGAVDLKGDFTSLTDLVGLISSNTVAITPGTATTAVGSATIVLSYDNGEVDGSFSLNVSGLASKQKLTLCANGIAIGKTKTTTTGLLKINELDHVNLANPLLLQAKDSSGNVVFSVQF